jgi:anti-sigma B factor antagonist
MIGATRSSARGARGLEPPDLSLTGELDLATAPEFDEAIELAQRRSAIVLDLRELTFIDSMGVRAPIQAYKAGQDGHSTVSFVPGSRAVQHVLELSGVEPLLMWTEPPGESAEDAS